MTCRSTGQTTSDCDAKLCITVWRWHWPSAGQIEPASRLTAPLGRLIGGWQRAQEG
jgi:hypothetical protein